MDDVDSDIFFFFKTIDFFPGGENWNMTTQRYSLHPGGDIKSCDDIIDPVGVFCVAATCFCSSNRNNAPFLQFKIAGGDFCSCSRLERVCQARSIPASWGIRKQELLYKLNEYRSQALCASVCSRSRVPSLVWKIVKCVGSTRLGPSVLIQCNTFYSLVPSGLGVVLLSEFSKLSTLNELKLPQCSGDRR